MEQDTGSGLLWALLILAITAIGIGCMAQGWKRRTGAAWGCGAFIFMIALYLGLYFIVAQTELHLFEKESSWTALGIMTAIFGMVLLTLIIATLPRRESK